MYNTYMCISFIWLFCLKREGKDWKIMNPNKNKRYYQNQKVPFNLFKCLFLSCKVLLSIHFELHTRNKSSVSKKLQFLVLAMLKPLIFSTFRVDWNHPLNQSKCHICSKNSFFASFLKVKYRKRWVGLKNLMLAPIGDILKYEAHGSETSTMAETLC